MVLGIGWANNQCQAISGCSFGEDELFDELFFDTIEECEEACGMVGDVNQDNSLNILDVVTLVNLVLDS